VDLTHDPEDEDAFAAISGQLVAGFERSPGGADRGWVADQLLQFKHGYLDGDLGRWTAADLSEVLFELYPRKVVLEPGDDAEVLAGTAAFLRSLDAEELLSGEAGDELAGLVERAGEKFAAAMRDERKWGPGKRLFGGAAAAGVDLTDQKQLDAYVRGINALPHAAREALLGPSPGLTGRALPPVVLAAHEKLVTAAESAMLLRWVRGLVEHVGKGLALTDKGNLKVADGTALVTALGTEDRVDEVIGEQTFPTRSTEEMPDVDLTFRLALAAGFLAVDGRRLVPSDAASMPAEEPLDALFELWHALVEDVGPMQHRWAKDTYGFGWYAEFVDARLPEWHLQMYGEPAGLDLADAAARTWSYLLDDFDLDEEEPAKLELHRGLVGRGIVDAFGRLEQLGVVRLEDVPEDHRAEVAGTGHLTPLGTWVVQRIATRTMPAPVAGALAELGAEELLGRVVDLAEDVARLEVWHWVERRGDGGAADLVAAPPAASETSRGVAFSVLLDLGAAAVEAVESLQEHPELAPFRTVLRVDALAATEAEMVAVDPEQWVRLLAAVLELRGPSAVVVWAGTAAGETGLLAVLEAAWRVRLPQTAAVLDAPASTSTDKSVAKAARKAAYKLRSARGAGVSRSRLQQHQRPAVAPSAPRPARGRGAGGSRPRDVHPGHGRGCGMTGTCVSGKPWHRRPHLLGGLARCGGLAPLRPAGRTAIGTGPDAQRPVR
jgi:hypothetical protein